MNANTSADHELQKAVVVLNAGQDAKIEIRDVPVPQPKDDEVLIRLHYSGVCHADVSFVYGDWKQLGFVFEGSQTPGHEGVGTVTAIGRDVKDLEPGARVGIRWIRRVCRICYHCRAGNDNWCESQLQSGRTTPGSFQQYVTAPADYLPMIPPEVSDEHAGPLLCAGSTIYLALRASKAASGDWIVITGAGGGLGHLGIQFAKVMGFRVIAVDSSDRKSFCMAQGAEVFIDFLTSPDLPGEVRDITRSGASAVIVTAASRKSYEQATQMLGYGGTLVCVGLPTEMFNIPLQPKDFLDKSCSVTGIGAGSLRQVREALNFAAKHQIQPVVEIFPLGQAEDVFKRLHQQKIIGRAILDLR